MSHVVKMNLQILSLKALERACKKLNLNFNKDVKTFNYYGSSRSNCDHTISAGGDSKAIGVCQVPGKKEFELKWDPGYLNPTTQKAVGRSGENLKKEYAVAQATLTAESQGMYVTRYDQNDGSVRLEAQFQ